MQRKRWQDFMPVAIIGMAFRLPGNLNDEQQLWEALREGRDVIGEIDPERWPVGVLQHPRRSEPGRSVTFAAGVLARIDQFDADFFGLSPREAAWLDPQQRLLLELAWEAMENGAQVPARLAGSDCAVYVGISGVDYGMRGLDDLSSMTAHSMTGNTLSIAANRLSYVFDLRGPSIAVDTACSSSLVALHHACRSLQTGEASQALVGGVNLLMHPYPFVGFTKASMLSATGRCRAFDASADGYVRAEGATVLLLKPLAQAEADGDPIQAVILASGVNADGRRKTGITIPSATGQADLMRMVLRRAGLPASAVDYVEAHGTGTAVGDPIEANAIGDVYGRERATALPIGSIKTNIGHLEPASGLAGVVKTVLMLKHRALLPSLHLDQPNPHIDFRALNLEVATRYAPLRKRGRRPLVMAVSSFGFGGANAHILLREYPVQRRPRASIPPVVAPLLLSARTPAALRDLAGRYAKLLSAPDAPALYDIAHSAAFDRQHLEQRLCLKVENASSAAELLERFANGECPAEITLEEAPRESGTLAFVYSGNGSQWAGMGRRLLAESPRFVALMTELDRALHARAGFSILEEIRSIESASRLADTAVAQPVLFAMQVAITHLLREQGVEADAVAGHSVGEVAAAWAAGALSLEQAIEVICARSAAQALTRGAGRMAAVGLSEQDMRELLTDPALASIELAGINSPSAVTVAGPLDQLELLREHLAPRKVAFHLLGLEYAFHSRAMDPVEGQLQTALATLVPGPSSIPFVSAVTGHLLDGNALTGRYWWDNIRRPVQFAQAMRTLISRGCRLFLEIGPRPILQGYMQESLAGAGARILHTLRPSDDGKARIEETALKVILARAPSGLEALFPAAGRRVRLPNYPWQRERHWHPRTTEAAGLFERVRVHPLLGWRLQTADAAWENVLDPMLLTYLADHCVAGAVTLPAAAYVELALAAARDWFGGTQFELEALDILAPLVFDPEQARNLRFELAPRDGSFRILSRPRLSTDAWGLHAVGRLLGSPMTAAPSVPVLAASAGIAVQPDVHYRLAGMLGLEYGPAFRGFAGGAMHDGVLAGAIEFPASVSSERADYVLHPVALDVCFQTLVNFFREEIETGQGHTLLPVKIGRLRHFGGAPIAALRARITRRGARSIQAEFALLDATGQLVATAEDCRFRALPVLQRHAAEPGQWRIHARLQPHPDEQRDRPIQANRVWVQQANERLAECRAAPDRRRYHDEARPLLDALVIAYAFSAFRELDARHAAWLQQALERPETLDAQRQSYFRWLAGLLEEASLLRRDASGWQFDQANAPPPPEEIWRTLLGDFPELLPELLPIGRIGRRLAALLHGEAEPAALTQSLSQSQLIEQLFADSPAYADMNRALHDIVAGIAGHLPKGQRLRILEISASPGDFTRRLASELSPERVDYVVAGVRDQELAQLEAEFKAHRTVIVASQAPDTLELAADTKLPALFDLVIVRHWLHRAPDIPLALAALHRRLAPGGTLILAERAPDLPADFVHGIDPNWWWRETQYGPMSSLNQPAGWVELLEQHGFGDIESISGAPEEQAGEGAYLVLATTPAVPARTPEHAAACWLLVCEDEHASDLGERVLLRLESRGQQVKLVHGSRGEHGEFRPDDPQTARALLEWACQEWGTLDHVVYFGGSTRYPGSTPPKPEELESARCLGALHLVQAITEAEQVSPRLWVVTSGGALVTDPGDDWRIDPLSAPLWGLGRVIMNEYPALSCALIDLAAKPGLRTLDRLIDELLAPDGETEIVLAPSGRYTLRLERAVESTPAPSGANTRFHLDFRGAGQLHNLLWRPHPQTPLGNDQIEVMPSAVGLNFRDVMYAMGVLPEEAIERGFSGGSLGLEFAGTVSRVGPRVSALRVGDEVMGFGPASFASHVVTNANAVTHKPAEWSFAQAASVPTVFFTVYYALKYLADVQAGERVLIHGAAGGVGIAAVQLAQHLGAEVFATAGSDEKRDFVHLLGVEHVFDSRRMSFADEVLAVTGGEGVDVVLNSLAGEAINRNLRVLKPFGRFLELGKRDFIENTPIGLRAFKDNISYFAVDADQLLVARPRLAERLLREIMSLFRDGTLVALPQRVFPAARVVDAFRFMQQSRQIGKVVIALDKSDVQVQSAVPAPSKLRFNDSATYLVTGGLEGFGLETARWLAERGAGHLVLIGRRGMETPGAAEAVAQLQATGARVHACACDVSHRASLEALLAHIDRELPPLRGVIHAAMVLDDQLLSNLDAMRLRRVLAPKLLGAWHLHELTLARALDQFVLYSSLTTFIGNPGQANYVAANAYLEALATWRRMHKLPATCIAWGAIGDAGYLTRNAGVKEALRSRLGAAPVSARQALAALERALIEDRSQIAVADLDFATIARLLPSARGPRFEVLRHTNGQALDTDLGASDIRAEIAGRSFEEVRAIIAARVAEEVAKVLTLDARRLDHKRSLRDLGMDSLMAMELSLGMERRFGLTLPAMAFNEGVTVERVAERLTRILCGAEVAAQDEGLDGVVRRMAAQHAEQISGEDVMQAVEQVRREALGGTRLIP